MNVSVVVGPLARTKKLRRWYGLVARSARLISGTPPNEAEKALGVPPSLAKSKLTREVLPA